MAPPGGEGPALHCDPGLWRVGLPLSPVLPWPRRSHPPPNLTTASPRAPISTTNCGPKGRGCRPRHPMARARPDGVKMSHLPPFSMIRRRLRPPRIPGRSCPTRPIWGTRRRTGTTPPCPRPWTWTRAAGSWTATTSQRAGTSCPRGQPMRPTTARCGLPWRTRPACCPQAWSGWVGSSACGWWATAWRPCSPGWTPEPPPPACTPASPNTAAPRSPWRWPGSAWTCPGLTTAATRPHLGARAAARGRRGPGRHPLRAAPQRWRARGAGLRCAGGALCG